jgi:predicted RNA-binding Zn-ribbon protein involved in translation (DUF1610 family)
MDRSNISTSPSSSPTSAASSSVTPTSMNSNSSNSISNGNGYSNSSNNGHRTPTNEDALVASLPTVPAHVPGTAISTTTTTTTVTATTETKSASFAVCADCGNLSANIQRCTSCRQVFYCSKTCQQSHWNKHREVCRELAQISTPAVPAAVLPVPSVDVKRNGNELCVVFDLNGTLVVYTRQAYEFSSIPPNLVYEKFLN